MNKVDQCDSGEVSSLQRFAVLPRFLATKLIVALLVSLKIYFTFM